MKIIHLDHFSLLRHRIYKLKGITVIEILTAIKHLIFNQFMASGVTQPSGASVTFSGRGPLWPFVSLSGPPTSRGPWQFFSSVFKRKLNFLSYHILSSLKYVFNLYTWMQDTTRCWLFQLERRQLLSAKTMEAGVTLVSLRFKTGILTRIFFSSSQSFLWSERIK